MLTDDELAGMRAALEESMPERGEITRPTTSADGLGGRTTTYSTVATVVPMRVSPLPSTSLADTPLAGRVSNEKRWLVTMPAGTDVRTADRINVLGRTFEVDSINSSRTFEVSTRVIVDEVI